MIQHQPVTQDTTNNAFLSAQRHRHLSLMHSNSAMSTTLADQSSFLGAASQINASIDSESNQSFATSRSTPVVLLPPALTSTLSMRNNLSSDMTLRNDNH